MKPTTYFAYVDILKRHLRPALGCTEPIAIAYAAAVARHALGCMPERAEVLVSGNIIKNAKSVTVPNTKGKKGIDAACAAGIIAGRPEDELEAIASVTERDLEAIDAMLSAGQITVGLKPDARLFDILITLHGQGNTASARIADRHTNIVTVTRNGQVLKELAIIEQGSEIAEDEALLSIEEIYEFANTCDLADVRDVLRQQIDCNDRIAQEGIRGGWGACVGSMLLKTYGTENVRIRAKALAAAGSDARMSGCEMPVVINSGSGNQGITVSIPVIEYARELGATEDLLLRALTLSNLTAIHIKSLIGCLSAYCGAVTAASASGAGIAYLKNASLDIINHTIVNCLAILSGTICDGAKPSCAAKIACAVDAGIMGYEMAISGREFVDGEGIVCKGVENTIRNVGRLGKIGMRETDQEILRMMLKE